MRITYYALKPITVGDEVRQIGDLVPEAQTWPYLEGYVGDGKIAPVLVATLPEEVQQALLEWEQDVLGVVTEGIPEAEQVAPVASEAGGDDESGTDPDDTEDDDEEEAAEAVAKPKVVRKPTKAGA